MALKDDFFKVIKEKGYKGKVISGLQMISDIRKHHEGQAAQARVGYANELMSPSSGQMDFCTGPFLRHKGGCCCPSL